MKESIPPYEPHTKITASRPAPQASPRGWSRWAAALGGGLLALAGVSIMFITRSPAEPSTRYLVIEKPGESVAAATAPEAAPTTSVATATSPTTAVAVASPEPVEQAVPATLAVEATPTATTAGAAPTKQPTGAAAARPDAGALSVKFRRHQPQIETCFQRHAAQIQGQPQISVRFEVDTRGTVTGAQLSPASLAGTPLGTCVLGVARSVQFGPLSEPVAFSIPITAHRSP